ncbi:hypothetical protein Mgra_00001086 [Meloidogyne graminicola]|uniref:Uncharacterized protein n=1 Tax=Meloidogyne graminicola TaxID=189291 RepID=A0A8T0A090_9BILA|nr:hypothetical protein Mgra_00001086 [Meloidogyne graminicola]
MSSEKHCLICSSKLRPNSIGSICNVCFFINKINKSFLLVTRTSETCSVEATLQSSMQKQQVQAGLPNKFHPYTLKSLKPQHSNTPIQDSSLPGTSAAAMNQSTSKKIIIYIMWH